MPPSSIYAPSAVTEARTRRITAFTVGSVVRDELSMLLATAESHGVRLLVIPGDTPFRGLSSDPLVDVELSAMPPAISLSQKLRTQYQMANWEAKFTQNSVILYTSPYSSLIDGTETLLLASSDQLLRGGCKLVFPSDGGRAYTNTFLGSPADVAKLMTEHGRHFLTTLSRRNIPDPRTEDELHDAFWEHVIERETQKPVSRICMDVERRLFQVVSPQEKHAALSISHRSSPAVLLFQSCSRETYEMLFPELRDLSSTQPNPITMGFGWVEERPSTIVLGTQALEAFYQSLFLVVTIILFNVCRCRRRSPGYLRADYEALAVDKTQLPKYSDPRRKIHLKMDSHERVCSLGACTGCLLSSFGKLLCGYPGRLCSALPTCRQLLHQLFLCMLTLVFALSGLDVLRRIVFPLIDAYPIRMYWTTDVRVTASQQMIPDSVTYTDTPTAEQELLYAPERIFYKVS